MLVNVADIETDGFDPSVIHCLILRVVNTDTWEISEPISYLDVHKGSLIPLDPKGIWVFHNGINFDVPVLRSFGYDIKQGQIIDTFVCSRLFNYSKFRTHSLKELGEYLKVYKGDFKGPWDKRTTEMEEYCLQDVDVTIAVLKHFWPFISNPDWRDSLRVEHDIAMICREMQDNGFYFNDEKALDLLTSIESEMSTLESQFKAVFPPRRVEVKRLKHRTKKDGTLFSGVLKAIKEYPDHEIVEDELVCYSKLDFSPAKPKDRIDVLWDAGWKPTERTKGHKKWIREAR